MLQLAVAVLSLIPIGAGTAGAAFGMRVFDHASLLGADADNLSRYLSGLLLGIGLAFVTTLPRIETEGVRFRLLTTIVFIGGIAVALKNNTTRSVRRTSGFVLTAQRLAIQVDGLSA